MLSLSIKGLAIDTSRRFTVINASDGLADNSAQTILSLPDGRMVMTTMGYINIYDGIDFTHINTEKGDFFTLPNYTGNYHLYLDNANRMWLKNKQTVTCVDLLTEQSIADIEGIFRAEGVNTSVVDVFVDSEGCLWMMSEGHFYGSGKPHSIQVNDAMQLQDLDVIGDSIFLFYSTGEVVCHNISSGVEVYRLEAYSHSLIDHYGRTSVVKRCADGFVQIRNGFKGAILQRLDVKNRHWTTIKEFPHKLNNLIEREGKLYIPSAYGYWTYNLATEELKHYKQLTMIDGHKLDTDINVIAFDYQGGMWLGTESRGLLYSKPVSSPFIPVPWYDESGLAEHYAALMDTVKLPDLTAFDKNTNCVYRDSRGWTWIGTLMGVDLRRTETEDPIHISKKSGLTNEVIHSIIEDDNHNIWLSTSYGISCLVIEDDTIKLVNSYVVDDNIPSETFRNGRAVKDEEGNIAMEAIENVVVFNPTKFSTSNLYDYNLRPTLISMAVNGSELDAGMKISDMVVLDKAVTHTNYIRLESEMNTVVFTFSGLNYFRPLQTYYRVRIPGIINQWRTFSYFATNEYVSQKGTLRLPLVALPPGVYRVEVQASFVPYDWKSEPLVITLEIMEPWWKTGGLYILFIIVIVALIIANVYYYNRNYRLSTRRNTQQWDVLKRLRTYISRCEMYSADILAPTPEEISGLAMDSDINIDDKFIDLIMGLRPIINKEKLSIRDLCHKTGFKMDDFYELINANINKNPQVLSRMMRLEDSRNLLMHEHLTIDEIAEECNFISTNYFIASFYSRYRVTPNDYRESVL